MITQVCIVLQNAIVWQKQIYRLASGLRLGNRRLSGSLVPMRGSFCRFHYTELAYTKDGSERLYRAAFSPQEETENWRLYARLWTRAATVAGTGWLGLSIAWYQRARRRKKARQKAT